MSTQWILQANHRDQSLIRSMEDALVGMGRSVFKVPLKGYSPDIPDIEGLSPADPVICYGPSFVPRTLRRPEWSPGIFFDPDAFRWSAFQAAWPDLMLSSDAKVVPLSQAGELVAIVGAAFVRPDEDTKAFDGGVFDAAALQERAAAVIEKGYATPETPVVVAPPVEVTDEWRLFIVDGEVVGASSYRHGGRPSTGGHVPHHVIELSFEAARIWRPAPVFCLDFGRAGDRIGIVEANCFNAARFYGADGNAILEAVSDYAERAFVPVPRP